jgi:uncharacterized protein YdhG (YjbR/CyaY superfamily)
MTYELSNEEKVNIIDQHIRSLSHTVYNSELDLVEANASNPVDENRINTTIEFIESNQSKVLALLEERSKLTQ